MKPAEGWRRGFFPLFVIALSGCTVGPRFKPPPAPSVKAYTAKPLPKETASAKIAGGGAQRFVAGLKIPGEWWRLFHSKALDAIVKEALQNNPDLAAARAALRRAFEQVEAARGALYPLAAADVSASRNKTAASLGAVPANGELYYSLFTPQLTVAYNPDVFGGVRSRIESRAATAEARRFELEAAYLSLTSNVVADAIAEALLRARIEATRDVIRIAGEELKILRRQEALGEVAGADVAAQEAALAAARADLPPLQKALSQERDRMAALAGRYPSEQLTASFTLSSLTLPRDLPLSLPARLVAQRPDVRAAEAQLHEASAEIGVAVAARLPQLTLDGAIGSSALTLGGLGAAGNLFWGVAGDVSQTVFDAGTLLHRQRAAEAAYEEAAAQYRRTVLGAFRDVADALHALLSDAEALKSAVTAERAAKKSLDIARRQLALGAINYLGLLNAQKTYARARLRLARARANRFTDTAALFEALGGGWWHRRDLGFGGRDAKEDAERAPARKR